MSSPQEQQQQVVQEEEKQEVQTLQEFFESQLLERGYQLPSYDALQTGYHSQPTELQKDSYGPHMIESVKSGNVAAVREALNAGLSPNPCNSFGESLVHLACRRGNIQMLQVFLDAGTCLGVTDDFGKTLLHDACWCPEPAFAVFAELVKRDKTLLFCKDRRGSLPLSYVHKDDWAQWKEWLVEHILDRYFPSGGECSFEPSDLVAVPPNTWPVPDVKATPVWRELIQMIARGDLSPQEAQLLARTHTAADFEDADDILTYVGDSTVATDSMFGDDDDSSFYSDYDSDDDEEYEEEMMEMLNMSHVIQGSAF